MIPSFVMVPHRCGDEIQGEWKDEKWRLGKKRRSYVHERRLRRARNWGSWNNEIQAEEERGGNGLRCRRSRAKLEKANWGDEISEWE